MHLVGRTALTPFAHSLDGFVCKKDSGRRRSARFGKNFFATCSVVDAGDTSRAVCRTIADKNTSVLNRSACKKYNRNILDEYLFHSRPAARF
jgi:hypothetical protein